MRLHSPTPADLSLVACSYYHRKARFQGSDLKTAGSPQGCVRPENSYSMWMAYQATKDPLYLRSLRAIISHMSYSQWDNIGDPRAFGGGDEGTNIPCDVVNGFGAHHHLFACHLHRIHQ